MLGVGELTVKVVASVSWVPASRSAATVEAPGAQGCPGTRRRRCADRCRPGRGRRSSVGWRHTRSPTPPGPPPSRHRRGERGRCRGRRVVPDGCLRLAEEDAAEPVPLDLGHMTEKAVERQGGGGDGSALASGVVEALALDEQGGAEVVEPRLEHGSFIEEERWILSAGVLQVVDHGVLLSAGWLADITITVSARCVRPRRCPAPRCRPARASGTAGRGPGRATTRRDRGSATARPAAPG